MLFNSLEFLLGFLPWALAGYWLLGRYASARLWFLLAASTAFYGYWDWRFVPLLVGSILVNWAAVQGFFVTRRRDFLVAAIVANLLCLGAFKYLGFFAGIVAAISGLSLGLVQLALPLGISFFTFHHIIYLVDLLRGRAPRYGLRDYALYIALFPQILAGPLVRHSEIIHQFPAAPARPGWEERCCRGVALFLLGLGKKLFLADALASHVDPIHLAASHGTVTIGEAWSSALAFPLQIYFDFSGYSDMAIGLGRLLGFHFPENFDQPYRSANITEFWRRWHMTLSRWFRDYVYISLGGNRKGRLRTFFNLWIVFFLCGLWHGAGLTFIAWGLYHGLLLIVERFVATEWHWRPSGALGVAMCFVLVTIGWVFFRSPSLSAAGHYLAAMFFLAPATPGVLAIKSELTPEIECYLLLGVFFAFAPLDRVSALRFDRPVVMTSQLGLAGVSLVYSSVLLAANSFNPFIYFRF